MFNLTDTLEALTEMGFQPFTVTKNGQCFHVTDCSMPFSTPASCSDEGARLGVIIGPSGFQALQMPRMGDPQLVSDGFTDLLQKSGFDDSQLTYQVDSSDAVQFFYRTDTTMHGEVQNRKRSGECVGEIMPPPERSVELIDLGAFQKLLTLQPLKEAEEGKLLELAAHFASNFRKSSENECSRAGNAEASALKKEQSHFEFYSIEELVKIAAIPRPPKMLGHLVRKGELSVLFSSSGVGKSTLALQLAVNVARGTSLDEHYLPNRNSPSTVLYFDLENPTRTIAERVHKGFEGSDRLHVVKEAVDADDLKSPSEFVKAIQQAQKQVKSDLIVIDNMSCFYMDGEKKSEANKLITPLHEIAQTGPAVLVIAHTPKRVSNTPIGLADLSGSAQFGNRPDHVFALNQTSTPGNVYLIEFKAREDQKLFEQEVLVMSHSETDYGRGFRVLGTDYERELLASPMLNKDERNREILDHYNKVKSVRATAKHFGLGKSQVGDIVKAGR
ncbi:AAA family ATPase [Flavobacteriales bacterium]|nr:AAA family ATPase [Flavobacteriales bacterium]